MTDAPVHIAFFGHDAADAAIRRRVQAFQNDGLQVTGFMMHRRDPGEMSWENVDLGRTRDGAFVQRFRSIFSGASLAAKHADRLRAADLIYARNLDMLALAFLAKRKLKLKTPAIYESLDVHRMLSRSDLIGKGLRWIEGQLLRRCAALVVSSPGFIENHFERYYSGAYKPYLVENRLASGADYGPRPAPQNPRPEQPLQLGWVGMLRCKRSLDLLALAADQLGERVHIHLHGIPARTEIAVFEPVIDARENMTYHGRYRSPEDLAGIYAPLDLVWAGDFMEAGQNSVWLLPNRIYEGGYYNVPSVAPAGTQTAAWLETHDVGVSVGESLETNLPNLLRHLDSNRQEIHHFKQKLHDQSETLFVQPKKYLLHIISEIIEDTAK
ncbi:MAG: glycosyl transferase [Pseudomonadota bacterium]